MLVVLKPGTPEAAAADAITRLRMAGLAVHRTEHDGRVRIAAVGDTASVDWKDVAGWASVESVAKLARPFKLASRAFHPHDTVISVGRIAIGGRQLAIMAGPCSVEGEEPDLHHRQGRRRGGRHGAARRRLQAAHIAVRVPGPR